MSRQVNCYVSYLLRFFFYIVLFDCVCGSSMAKDKTGIKVDRVGRGMGKTLEKDFSIVMNREWSEEAISKESFKMLGDLPSMFQLIFIMVCVSIGLFMILAIACKLQERRENPKQNTKESISKRPSTTKRYYTKRKDIENTNESLNDSNVFDDSNIKSYFKEEETLKKYAGLFKDINIILESKEPADSDLSYIDISLNKV